MKTEKYILYSAINDRITQREVSKLEFIKAEREAGFRPKMASNDPRYMTVCATGGFAGAYKGGIIKYK
jgi:hypothetical protein